MTGNEKKRCHLLTLDQGCSHRKLEISHLVSHLRGFPGDQILPGELLGFHHWLQRKRGRNSGTDGNLNMSQILFVQFPLEMLMIVHAQ